MKVLIISHSGLSDDSFPIYQEYIDQGVELSVIVPTKIFKGESYDPLGHFSYSSELKNKKYKIIPVDLRKPHSYGEGFKFGRLFKAIKQAKPDLIDVFDEYSSLYLFQVLLCRNILLGKKVPVVCFNGMIIPFKAPPFVWEFSLRFFKRIVRKILHPIVFAFHKKYLDGVAACTNEAGDVIRALGYKNPIKRIFWAVDIKTFYPKDSNLCREKLGIPKDIKLVGNIGRFSQEKGLDKLIKAVSQLNEYYLMLVGSGDYEPELQKLIDSLGMRNRFIRFKGADRQELVDYYNALDVFVLPSQTTPTWKEIYGRVLAEAIGCRLAVVGSSSGGIPEVLEGYPKHLIFQEESADDLANKIKKVEGLKIPKNFNINKFLERYNVQGFVKEHIEFYKELLKKYEN